MLKSMTEGRGAYNTAWRSVIKQKILLLLVLAKFVINYTSNSERVLSFGGIDSESAGEFHEN
ncbi:hypothetical protein SCA6_004870 [Theobroma cacao]